MEFHEESDAVDDSNPLGFKFDDDDLNWESLDDLQGLFAFENCSESQLDDALLQCEIRSTTSSNSSQTRKRKLNRNNETPHQAAISQKKKEYYLKKQAIALKWKRLLGFPQLLCRACNSTDIDAVRHLVNEYFTEDCTYKTKVKTAFGREAMAQNLVVLDEACPDVVIAYKDFRIENNEIRWTFSFSGTKQFASAADASFDPLTAPGASKRLFERASIIHSLGRKYVYFGTGTANLIPTPSLDRVHTFYISSHRCDVRFAETDEVDECTPNTTSEDSSDASEIKSAAIESR